jgi:hypothetical protein
MLEEWLNKIYTNLILRECIIEYARGCGGTSMEIITCGLDTRYQEMASNQGIIGWRRFMEGMICRRARTIQMMYHSVSSSKITPERRAYGTITKLLEATHGQWLCRCVCVC